MNDPDQAKNEDQIQERYYEYMLHQYKKETEMSELREDHMEYTALQAAINLWATENKITPAQVEQLIEQSPESRPLILKRYWESRTL
jgi:hypothetical protein